MKTNRGFNQRGQMPRTSIDDRTGEAHAFFYCDRPYEELEEEISFIEELTGAPNRLERTLEPDINVHKFKYNPELTRIALEAQRAGMNYTMSYRLPDATDIETANNLATSLNQAYQSPLYKDGEKFRGEIVHEEKDKFQFMN